MKSVIVTDVTTEETMRMLFGVIAIVLGLFFGFEPVTAEACDDVLCGNVHAPGRGAGVSACIYNLVAPEDARDLEVQMFDYSGHGLLTYRGKPAIRGGQPGTMRVSIDCSMRDRAYSLHACVTVGGEKKQRIIWGEELKMFLPADHKAGGKDIPL